ncbi:hypothetical protein WA026_002770 [Henosepilachna vigintioctopunctata]|uniref:Hexosyltransferase n=1 Tax=Henosepilachna vigintioctopunctata TaxID=420089 RepID=A0AAW1U3B1_9CUCU
MRRAFSNNFLRTVEVRRVFLLGVTPDNKYINQKSVEDEARRYNDIVQGNFQEAYRNLTYKHVMGLKWVSQYCSKTKFVIKMDDDIIVNILKTMNLLNQWNAEKEFIAGYILKGLKAKRLKANKWFVTREEYPANIYPPFASGWFYITTPKVCTKLLKLTDSEKYFWIDDVFVTGILAEKIHIKKYDIKGYFTDHPEYFQCCLNDLLKYKFDCDILVGPNGGRTDLFFEFNQAFSKCVEHKCLNRSFPMNESCIGTKSLHLGRGNAVISTYKLI